MTTTLRTRFIAFVITTLSITQFACSSSSSPSGPPAVSISNVSIAEGNSGTSNLVFTLSLTGNAGSSASVDYTTSNNSATAGTDYIAKSGTLTFTGTNTASIPVTVNGDTTIESTETFTITLSNPVGVTLSNTTASGTITNDDNGGYYTGSASITAPVLEITGTNLQAIFNNDDFILASNSNTLLYTGTITSRSGNDYSGTVRIYKDGEYVSSATVEGIQIPGSSVTGTFSGTGEYTTGSFDVDYESLNSRAPLVFENGDQKHDSSPIDVVLAFASNAVATVDLRNSTTAFALVACDITGATLSNVNSEQPGRIRSFSGNLTGCSINTTEGVLARGYFTSFDQSGTDNVILFALFTDDYAQLSLLNCTNNVCP